MPEVEAIYVQMTENGSWRVVDSRVSLDSIVFAYWDGKSPEAIVEEIPALSSEQVYGAIAFYLHHKHEVDQYLRAQDTRWQAVAAASEAQHGPLLDRLRKSRLPGTDGASPRP